MKNILICDRGRCFALMIAKIQNISFLIRINNFFLVLFIDYPVDLNFTGIVMSMYTLLRNNPQPSMKDMETYFQVFKNLLFNFALGKASS